MPHQPTVTEIRIHNTIVSLELAVAVLNDFHDALGTPFVPIISNTALSLTKAIQTVKKNKDECIQLMERVHQVLYGIFNLHITSDTPGSLPPIALYDVGKFTQTLHKIHTFVEAQQVGNRIKNFFRQGEMNTLLKDCHSGVQHAMEAFKVESGATILTNIKDILIQWNKFGEEFLYVQCPQ
ncbi:hypothetical protein K438DRAFT_1980523 [Mycena galopus ATCC 62051]|nr:hypothetical protein K438DRAFT_1980523 [Mycena galopus ATCC 62051]